MLCLATVLAASAGKLETTKNCHPSHLPSKFDQRCDTFIPVLLGDHDLISSRNHRLGSSLDAFSLNILAASCFETTTSVSFVAAFLSFAVRSLRVFPTGAGRIGQRECERSVASVLGCERSCRLVSSFAMP